METILQTHALTKSYRGKTAVNAVNMTIHKGKIYGFVGPNGAGKSTLMKMLLGLVSPDCGDIKIFGRTVTGQNHFEVLKRMGAIIESPFFYDKLSGQENLRLHCAYMGYPNREQISRVLALVGLDAAKDKPVRNYSLGMKQRLAIGRAILTKPEFLILDEPINALDPEGIREMRALFRNLNEESGVSILISSHILSEVEQIADTIGIIRGGTLLQEVPMAKIHEYQTEYIDLVVGDTAKAGYLLTEKLGLQNLKILSPNNLRIYDTAIHGSELSNLLVQNGVALESLSRRQNTLEDYFFEITGGEKNHA